MNDLISRLRLRAEIRRQISTRKSVTEGKPDRISDLLEEAANAIEMLYKNPQGAAERVQQYYKPLSNEMYAALDAASYKQQMGTK
jgi:ABC-type nitrate/sulfonate/bicarbonate transport system substrate-binding protein